MTGPQALENLKAAIVRGSWGKDDVVVARQALECLLKRNGPHAKISERDGPRIRIASDIAAPKVDALELKIAALEDEVAKLKKKIRKPKRKPRKEKATGK